MSRPSIAVLGSCVIDLIVSVPRLPVLGETLIGSDASIHVGGKGVNQAIGVARSDAEATMIGRIGDDPFGESVLDALDAEGIDREHVVVDRDATTGLGLPLVEPSGANAIVFTPGANGRITPLNVAAAEPAIRRADMLLLQLELPTDSAVAAARAASEAGTRILLNAAPAVPVPSALVGSVDLLVVNEIEARQLAGEGAPEGQLNGVIADLFEAWRPEAVVVTLGEDGVLVRDSSGTRSFAAFAVASIDAVGAGDAFCAGLAVEICRGARLDEAVAYGQAAGALATTKRGAGPAIPRRSEIVAILTPA
jgi:ribokinase